jgi:hypothetical protein
MIGMFAPFDEIDKKVYHLILIKSRTFLRHTSNNNAIKALYINLSVFFCAAHVSRSVRAGGKRYGGFP